MSEDVYTIVADIEHGRIDKFVSEKIPGISRSRAKSLILQKLVTLDSDFVKPTHSVSPGQTVIIRIPPEPSEKPKPQDIPVDLIYVDDFIAVVNKPPNLVVHAGSGRKMGTLVNALLFHLGDLPEADQETRPGIVHRLDKDTSGLLVVARTKKALRALQEQFAGRTVLKEYLAITDGVPLVKEGVINLGIGRHATKRKQMAAKAQGGREAATNYAVVESFDGHAILFAKPLTGRTHQIRVHLKSLGTPVLCDATYSRRSRIFASELEKRKKERGEKPVLSRQALHALRLSFEHPVTRENMDFEAPLPSDMQNTIDLLRSLRGAG